MKRPVLTIAIAALMLTTACKEAADSAPGAAPSGRIETKIFKGAEAGVEAPTPFRKTGDLYVLETGCDCVLAVTPAGEVSVVLTTQQILDVTGAPEVSLSGSGIAFDAEGTMYFAENESGSVLRMPRGGALETLADGPALTAAAGGSLVDIEGLALDGQGRLFVTDNETDSILRVDLANGEVSLLVSGAELGKLVGLETANLASGLVVGRGGIVFTTNEDEPFAVLGIDPVEGAGVVATSNLFEGLDGFMAVTTSGDLLALDTEAEVLFRVSTAGDVTTHLSEPQLQAPIGGDDGSYTGGIALDSDGNLYIVEAHENAILRFDPSFQGEVWVDAATIQTATRATPDLDGGIAFAPAD